MRDVGPLAAAAARPQATPFGEDATPDLWAKAAALLESVVNNHALVDGNKLPVPGCSEMSHPEPNRPSAGSRSGGIV